ncbi:MAG TPA: ABC transporter permease [Bryobacteraceae bacterium]|jgi:predicted permease
MPRLFAFWDSLAQDLRYGWRMLIGRPGFTAVAVLSIALGIGATTAIFSVIYAVLVDPYPYRAADRIGWLGMTTGRGDWQFEYSMSQYLEIKSRMRSMEDAVAVSMNQVVLTGEGLLPEVVRQENCSSNMFEFYGVPPLFGRAFTSKDFPAGRAPEQVAVISYKFWQHAFEGSRDVLGRNVLLSGKPYTVIGVLPIRFTWNDADAYTPMSLRPSTQDYVEVYFRIRPGITQQQIAAEFNPLFERFRTQIPRYFYPEGHLETKWTSVNEGILGKFATTLLVLFGAVLLLLLIACGNVANLLLARAAARDSEMAIRLSIGGTRPRLVRQMLTESVLLAVTGGALGVALAFVAVRAVVALLPEYSIPHEAVIALNWPVLWFAAAVSVLTGIIFGLVPALRASGKKQAEVLKSGTRSAGVGAGSRRFHNALMVFEITLSLVLLTGAGLAVEGLVKLQEQRLGYDPDGVTTFGLPVGESRYDNWASRSAFFRRVLERLARIPGVEAAAMNEAGLPPWNGFNTKLIPDNRASIEAIAGRLNLVSDGYFRAVRVPLLRGRLPSEADILRASPVAVVTQDLVTRYFANTNPIGRHIQVDLFNQPIPRQIFKAPQFNNSFEIVGVVGMSRNRGLREEPDPAMFIPYTILCAPNNAFLIRTASDPKAIINQVREAVKSVDPHQPITQVRTLHAWLNTASAYPRFATFLFGIFGGVGMLLAAAGVFSVVSYAVAHRTREFGIRMALGAKPVDVLRLVLAAMARILAVGLFAGITISIFVTRALANRMEGMGSADASLFALVPLLLTAATLLACFLPARAATLVQPMDALRHE